MSVIANSAVLVRLNISVWGASKRNKDLENEVARGKNADPKAMRMYDNLMVGSTGHKDVQKHAANVRLWHTNMTLPWDERGYRLCPTSLFLDYKSQHNLKRAAFDSMLDTFRVKYFSYRETARQYRGDMFNENDYPPVGEVMSKFAWNFVVAPVPESGHLCIDLPEQEMQELRQSCDEEVERKVAEAAKENEKRLLKELQGISAKCTDTGDDDEDDKKRWHDTFVTNPIDLCRMLKHMNLSNDLKVEEARQRLEDVMAGKTKEMFKDSPTIRQEVKDEVDSIITSYDW
tara:strand:+ start:1915 stop:2778 length:864 start_codon:yes stop_codon:yes gene_type:complete